MNERNSPDATSPAKATPHFAEKEKITMAILKLSGSISFLDLWKRTQNRLSLWGLCLGRSHAYIGAAILSLVCGVLSADQGYNVVQMSTAAPSGTEQNFLGAVSSQFLTTVTANPLASNTYAIKVFGPNPNYQQPAPPPTTLEQALSLGATVYVYGFADGQAYERSHDLGTIEHYNVNCSSPTFFPVVVDTTSCNAILGQLSNDIYTQNFSTPTVVPPPVGQ